MSGASVIVEALVLLAWAKMLATVVAASVTLRCTL